MELKDILQAVIAYGIKYLTSLVPFLASLSGIPVVGWLFGLAVGWVAGWLAKLIDLQIKYFQIHVEVQKEVKDVLDAGKNLKVVQDNKDATEAERAKALEDYRLAVKTLSKLKRPGS